MRRRTVSLEEQFNEITRTQAQFWLADTERFEQVHAALATLAELHRSVIALRYLEEMDYASIEQTLGLSNGAAVSAAGPARVPRRRIQSRSQAAGETPTGLKSRDDCASHQLCSIFL